MALDDIRVQAYRALIAMVGMNISQRFKVGYSYDFSISRFNNYSSGGHELTLGLMLGR